MFNIALGGSLTDWIDTNTITNADVIRPVITVNGNIIVSGEEIYKHSIWTRILISTLFFFLFKFYLLHDFFIYAILVIE